MNNSDDIPSPRRRYSKYMQIAMKLSKKSPSLYQMGAVVIRGGSVIGAATNLKEENGHAELRALNVGGDVSGATIYVSRLKRDGGPGISKPCPMCWNALRDAGIKKVVYFNRNGNEISKGINDFAWSDTKPPLMTVGMKLPMTYREIYQEKAEVA